MFDSSADMFMRVVHIPAACFLTDILYYSTCLFSIAYIWYALFKLK